jgi:hypothetical protein
MPALTTDEQAREVLASARTVAVLGAHHEPARAACYVPEYLHQQGYRVLPVNPGLVGRTLWGQPVVARVTDLDEQVDIVDVFRRSADVAAHVDELLAMKPLPTVVWLQLGIVNDAATVRLVAAGIDVIQDRCTLADHRRFRLPRVGG